MTVRLLTSGPSSELSPTCFPSCLFSDQGPPGTLVTPDQPCFPQGPVLQSSLQDSASQLWTQGPEEQFERKVLAKIQALQGLQLCTQGCPAGPPAP